jgi:alanyl-tRNA synthetase
MMTSTQIRQSFLDFFKSKQHTIVPSSSLLPESPNLLFTNAGMNQFVPIFLGQTKCPYTPGRAADTQKCIRAGGKHNDLEDVGLDTYHHTFFEMLGNWSFGDYFKREAIDWAWELVVTIWKFPPQRLYATVFCPHMDMNRWNSEINEIVKLAKASLDGAQTGIIGTGKVGAALEWSDKEAAFEWALLFLKVGCDPLIHIVPGNKKDNFWMMGETGPCGPCSELHVDLTPDGKTEGKLVNKGDARCIEIWNLVFIQFNANPDGTFSPLPARHVDTGMGFERVTSIIQGTKNLTDFANAKISNYETDIFRPIFDELEKLSGKKYGSTLPNVGQTSRLPSERDSASGETNVASASPTRAGETPALLLPDQIALDIAFRVIADHIRTLGFAIADGIQPGNNDRNYVLRRILRRAVRYGRTLGFKEPFFYKLVDVLADTMGDVFPEIRARKKQVQETIRTEEEAFNKTLDNGIEIFEGSLNELIRIKNFLQTCPLLLEKARQQIKDLGTWPTPRENEEGVWASIILDPIQSPEFTQDALESLAELPTGSFGKTILTKRIIIDWQKWWSALWNPIHNQLREIEKLIEYKSAFAECQGIILNAIAQMEAELPTIENKLDIFPGRIAFKLYDTYGFPLDLTELMARERGLSVDTAGFEKLMEEQRARARAAQKKEVISLSQIETTTPTKFVGYENLAVQAKVLEVVLLKDKTAVILDASACYAEMGGQVGDTGEILVAANVDSRSSALSQARLRITNTQKSGNTWLHFVEDEAANVGQASRLPSERDSASIQGKIIASASPARAGETPALLLPGASVTLTVDKPRRDAIQRHHTVTHLLHWALHEVASKDASQKGSFVGPDKLTFDFNSAPLTPAQVADIEKLVNERILENAGVSWTEVPHADVKHRKDVMQFFGDKYGDTVRVVQIGGGAGKLDGYSMELCGGTHTRATGEIGLFRITGESAIAAGVRRIEAVAGLEAYKRANDELHLIKSLAGKINSPVHELEKKIESLLEHQKAIEKQLKSAQQREASNAASELLERVQTVDGIPAIIHNVGGVDGDFLQAVADSLKGRFKGVIVLGGATGGAVSLVAAVSPEFISKFSAGKIIQQIAPIVGGKGGGRPDNARGGGKDATKLDEALAKAKTLLG